MAVAKLTDLQFVERLSLAVGLRRTGYYDYARAVAMDLVKVRPENASIWHTLGQIWTEQGEFDAALEAHTEAMRLLKTHGTLAGNAKEFQPMALGLAQAMMRYGRFADAWPMWEAGRLEQSWQPWPGSKYYDGEGDGDRTSILVQSEGGFGDTFMFIRWLPLLKRYHQFNKVGLMVWKSLYDFCDWSELGVDEVYKIDTDIVRFDQWQYATSIMSLPALFNVKSYADIPPPTRLNYRSYDSRQRIGSPNVGFCWRAEENSSPVRTKSLPLEVAQDINDLIGTRARIFSLSPEKADLYNTAVFAQPRGLEYELDKMQSWRDTATYMSGMDFILTVDTAVLHLAGLLGIPALGLLPRSSCWRWGTHDRKTGPWYGDQLTYYRQPIALEWDAEKIVTALMERLNAPTGIMEKRT